MSYTTIYETSKHDQVVSLKKIFEENNVRFKIRDESTSSDVSEVQVHENDVKRAEGLLLENGFLENPDPGESSESKSKFWLWLVIALICLAIAVYLISTLMKD